MEDFEEFYDAPLEFMDSFERSVQMSTEVRLNGESGGESENKEDKERDFSMLTLQNSKFQNGSESQVGHVKFEDLRMGAFGDLNQGLNEVQLQKNKFR